MMKKISDLYGKITINTNNSYPVLDRAISYGFPTAGAVLFAKFGTHDKDYKGLFAKDYSTWGLPAAILGYAGTQTALTYLKPKIDTIESKCLKSIASNSFSILDTVNNTLPYAVAFNMLPETYKANSVFAFKVLPAIFSGVESDIKNAVSGEKYTPTFTREVYASMISGLISKNVAKTLSDQIEVPKNVSTEDDTKKVITSSFDKALIEGGVDGILYALGKKYLIGKTYTESQMKLDVFKGLFQEMLFGSNYFNKTAISGLKDSVFDNVSQFALIELLTLGVEIFCGFLETKPTTQEQFDTMCKNCSKEELAELQHELSELLDA